ncbi:hypothetical protein [Mesorhizobium comanense]|uniref:hypothetical protein n=1 Tax=Mesorhizobium comanense TaxID=2502215 RepID=UPI00148547B0|nr:hypothetical protein [Mesorhizobium comanense]
MAVNRLHRLAEIKFATWVANGQLLFAIAGMTAAIALAMEGAGGRTQQKRRRG